jgi:Domain of unknown function (DUF4340)
MRGLRSTGLLLLVLIGLGAYIYFVTWRQPDPAQSTENRVYTPLIADEIVEFTLKAESGSVTTARKTGDAWEIVAPRTLPASIPQINGMTSMLAYLDVVRVIEEEPTDLVQYGLDNPRITVDFKVIDGRPFGALHVGKATPTGANMYARRADEKRVFLIGQHHEASLDRTTFDLREKKIVTFTRDEVGAAELTRGRERVALKKDGGRWVLTSPVAARADFTVVDAFVGSVEVAQMRAVATDEPTPDDLRKYGLDRPSVTAVLDVQGTPFTLLLGGKADEETFYAKEASKPTVFTVESLLATELTRPVADFRRKELFDFQPALANRVEFTRGGQTVVFERVKGEGENAQDSWKRVSPGPADADRTKFDALLTQLAAVRASSFATATTNTGLRAPILAVLVKFDENAREERVAFGRAGASAFASRPDEPGAAAIEGAQLDNILTALDELSK